jgi:hypothetical protein
MISDPDLSHQLDTAKQLSLNKKKGTSPWKVIFILLLAINVIFVFWAEYVLMNGSHGTAYFSGMGVFVVSLPLSIIDVIALLSYRFIKRLYGIKRVLSFTALVLGSLPLLFAIVLLIIESIVIFGKFLF